MDQLVGSAHLRFQDALTAYSSTDMEQNVPHVILATTQAPTQTALFALRLLHIVLHVLEVEHQLAFLVMSPFIRPPALHVCPVIMLTRTAMPATTLSNVPLATTGITSMRLITSALSNLPALSPIVRPA